MTETPRHTEYVALADLQGAPQNPKRHHEATIAASITRFGYVEAIAMDERPLVERRSVNSPPMTDRPVGRPTKLDNGTIEAFREGITSGLTIHRTCHHLGINDSTWRRWRQQGETDIAAGDTDTDSARLCTAVQEARLAAERRAVLAIVRAAVGDEQTIERTTTTTRYLRIYDDDAERWGYEPRTETSTTVERRTVRDWRAALAWLERTEPATYARVTRQWVSGPGEEPIQVHDVDDLRARLIADFDAMDLELAAANSREAHLEAVPVVELGE